MFVRKQKERKMSTTDSAALLHRESALHLVEVYGGLEEGDILERLVLDGVIAVGRLNEIIDSKKLDIPLNSVSGQDLDDGTDCKFATVVPKKGKIYQASVACKNKTGDLRVRLYFPDADSWWYGVIPHEVFEGLQGISFTFHKDTMKPSGRLGVFLREGWEPFSEVSNEALDAYYAPRVYELNRHTSKRGYERCEWAMKSHLVGEKKRVVIRDRQSGRSWEGEIQASKTLWTRVRLDKKSDQLVMAGKGKGVFREIHASGDSHRKFWEGNQAG